MLWTLANVAIQPASRTFGAIGALVWAQAIGGLLVIPWAFGFEGTPDLAEIPWLVTMSGGAAALLAYTGLFEALRLGQLALVVPVTSLWVVIAAGIGVGFLGEELSTASILGIGLVVAGNIAVTRFAATPSASEASNTPRVALVWAAVSGVGFGLMVPLVDVLGAEIGRLWALPTLWGAEILLGLPLWYAFGKLPPIPRGLTQWTLVTRVGVLEILGFVSLSVGLSLGSVSVVSPASSVGTALAVLWGVTILKERPPRPALMGASLAAIGVFLAAL